jgi:hypothetical protein
VEELVQALGTAGGEQGAEPDTPNRLLHLGDILGILSTADRLHDAGDLEGARAALHRPAIWRLQEQQSQARLAAYHLDLHAATGRHGFATAVACARVLEERTALRRPAAVPMERAWDAATLQRVRERAEAWLTAPEE